MALLGCGQPEKAKEPIYTANLLAAVRSDPGKPLIAPGSELSKGTVCKSHHSAYVWFEILKDGKPQVLSMNDGIRVVFKLPDGVQSEVFSVPSRLSQQFIALPTGFKSKANYADLEIYYGRLAEPIGTFRIDQLAAPKLAIGPHEPRMSNPRWKAFREQDGNGISIKMNALRNDSVSVVRLIRATYLDQSMLEYKPTLVFPDSQNSRLRIISEALDATDVELEETQYGMVSKRHTLTLEGLELEEVFDTPVLHLRSESRFQLEGGVEVTFPKQRLAPFREGRDRRKVSQLQVTVTVPDILVEPIFGSDLGGSARVEKMSPDLGAFGIKEVQIINHGGGIGTTASLRFSTDAEIKPGKLPPITFQFSVRLPKKIGTYKGIVPIERTSTG